jgi:hypothetical protein
MEPAANRKANSTAQVLNWNDEPIERVYVAMNTTAAVIAGV